MKDFLRSHKLDKVCYEIRGPAMAESRRLEEDGQRIIKLNIGNPAPWGFEAPEELIMDVIKNLPDSSSQGYCDAKGLFSARKAVMHFCQKRGIRGVELDDIYIGNGVSELIQMATNALMNNSDEVLVPAPDYPLWTAAVTLAGGKAVHYLCDEQSDWQPDLDDIRSKISANTKAIVIINPNNPTGAVYEPALLEGILEIARQHNLLIFADEIYDRILYDEAKHTSIASLADDVLCVTMSGLSKNYRAAGFRAGWMIVSGPKLRARSYIEGLDLLANMRMCANVPCQHASQTALGGYQSFNELVQPGGRLREQCHLAWKMLNDIPGVSCVKPKGALYLFPRLDPQRFQIHDDQKFVLDLLRQEKVLVVQGTGFNYPTPDHFRVVFLPRVDVLETALTRLGNFLATYHQ